MRPRLDTGHLALLRTLAERKCYAVERAVMRDCVRLVDRDGVAATAKNGITAFTPAEARRFLLALPDA